LMVLFLNQSDKDKALNESGFYYKINNNQRQQRADTVVFRKNIVA